MHKIVEAINALQAALQIEGIGPVTDFVFTDKSDLERLVWIAERDLSLVADKSKVGQLMTLCGVSLHAAP